MRINKLLLLWICLVLQSALWAQNFNRYFPKFYANGKELSLATAGGLRNPQFSSIDLNNDGIKDLFVFDKTGDKVLCFLNNSSKEEISYQYAPEYESIFPKLQTWALLHDFNKDGIQDIFCQPVDIGVAGIQVWKGQITNGKLSYRLMKLPFQNAMAVPLQNKPSELTNLYCSITDLPAIIDVDNDGDTDVLSFDSDGGKIVYFNNLSKERGFANDTFIMEAKDRCYGKIYESMFSSTLYLSEDGIVCATGNLIGNGGPRHSGSTILAFDEGCDGDKDLILGDISNTNIVFLRNTGNAENSWITYQDLLYPPSTPVDLFIFNTTFLLDVNNDNVKDLIVVPNEADGGVNRDHIWLYLNEGSDCNPSFKLQSKNFLVDQIASIGAKSNVAFLDINADGLKDLLMSGNGLNVNDRKLNKILYFKNTGSKTLPEFTLVEDNFLNMTNLTQFSVALAISAGDADGDSDDDIIIGTGNGELYYFENTAGANKPTKFATPIFPYMNLRIGSDANPHFYDIDDDGLNDLLAGEQNNSLNYYKNYGTKGGAPVYKMDPNTDDFGHIFKIFGYNTWYSAPYMVKNYNGKEIAVVGFQDGRISHYERKKTATTDSLILIAERMGNIYEGSKSTPELIDLDNNGFFDLVLGNFRGGLSFFNTPTQSKDPNAVTDIPQIDFTIYPNPTFDKIKISMDHNDDTMYEYLIYNALGTKVSKGQLNLSKEINVSFLPSGCYSLVLINKLNINVKKSFVKI